MNSHISAVITFFAVAIAAILMVSCESQNNPPMKKQFIENRILLEVNVLANERAVAEKFGEWLELDNPPARMPGFSVWRKDARGIQVCKIFVVDPDHANDDRRMNIIGHELLHCMYGQWHSEDSKHEAIKRG